MSIEQNTASGNHVQAHYMIREIGIDEIERRVIDLTDFLFKRLKSFEGTKNLTPMVEISTFDIRNPLNRILCGEKDSRRSLHHHPCVPFLPLK